MTDESHLLGKDSALKRYDSLIDMIGDTRNPTPLVALTHVAPQSAVLYAKLEWMNPFGSVKDRTAKWLLQEMQRRGELADGATVLEPTSGNTGIALASLCTLMGIPMAVTVPHTLPAEKDTLLAVLGAEVVPTKDLGNGRHPMDLAMDLAREMMAKHPGAYVMPNQYDNPDNALAHYETTGPEIWAQTEGRIDYFLAGLGTGGTLTGVGRYLKERNPPVRIIAVEPVPGHHISGLKNLQETSVPGNFDPAVIDEVVYVNDEETAETARRLHAEEALFAGSSGCAAVAGALKYLEGRDGVAVVLLPDSSQKAISYLQGILGTGDAE